MSQHRDFTDKDDSERYADIVTAVAYIALNKTPTDADLCEHLENTERIFIVQDIESVLAAMRAGASLGERRVRPAIKKAFAKKHKRALQLMERARQAAIDRKRQ